MRAWSWASMTRWKMGVSEIFTRIHRPMSTSTMLLTNGTRQPQAANVAASWLRRTTRKTALAAMNPTAGPSWGNMP